MHLANNVRFTVGQFDYVVETEYSFHIGFWSKSTYRNLKHLATPIELLEPNLTVVRILRGAKGAHESQMRLYLEGRAVRCVFDKYSNKFGQKVALTNALSSVSKLVKRRPKRAFRERVWKALFQEQQMLNCGHAEGGVTIGYIVGNVEGGVTVVDGIIHAKGHTTITPGVAQNTKSKGPGVRGLLSACGD